MSPVSVPGFVVGQGIVEDVDWTVRPTDRRGFSTRDSGFLVRGLDTRTDSAISDHQPHDAPPIFITPNDLSVGAGWVLVGHYVASPIGSLRASSLADGPFLEVAGALAWQG